ncbi:hypothetical protein [Bradyrhizobium elkanii]|uniref:hypothetical protein n=1 Tax=Bradyrhizobium elkanii TaxID=29448 RepID=UPI0007C556F2|nr:hypothetical protein [Bradyrhizobium elkanii]WLA85120.1 hypothetical protein QNJ99_13325 [Bradyrhizobium elkanii]
MIWKTFVNRLAITSRRRGLATAVVYGLSLAVRFTSAAGEEVEIPVQSAQRTYPAISIMTGDRASLSYQNWGLSSAQPIVLRQGSSLKSPVPARSSPECLAP